MRVVCFVCLVLLTLTGGVLAQEDAVYCGELADADCQILTDSAAVMSELESAVFHFDMNLSFIDDTSLSDDEYAVRLFGDGTYTVDPEQIEVLDFPTTENWQENMEALPDMMETALRSVSMDMSIIVEVEDPMSMFMDEDTGPNYTALELILADGFAYVNMDKLMGEDDFGYMPSGWQGIDLAQFYRFILEEQMKMLDEEGDLFADSDLDFEGPDNAAYMQIERLDDEEIAGQTVAVFQTTLDIAGYLSDSNMRDVLYMMMQDSLSSPGFEMDTDEVLDAYIEIFKDMDFRIVEAIGLEDSYVHQMSIVIEWKSDFGKVVEALDETGFYGDEEMGFEMNFDMAIDLSHFGEAPLAVAPEDATIIPLDTLLPYMFPDALDRA